MEPFIEVEEARRRSAESAYVLRRDPTGLGELLSHSYPEVGIVYFVNAGQNLKFNSKQTKAPYKNWR